MRAGGGTGGNRRPRRRDSHWAPTGGHSTPTPADGHGASHGTHARHWGRCAHNTGGDTPTPVQSQPGAMRPQHRGQHAHAGPAHTCKSPSQTKVLAPVPTSQCGLRLHSSLAQLRWSPEDFALPTSGSISLSRTDDPKSLTTRAHRGTQNQNNQSWLYWSSFPCLRGRGPRRGPARPAAPFRPPQPPCRGPS